MFSEFQLVYWHDLLMKIFKGYSQDEQFTALKNGTVRTLFYQAGRLVKSIFTKSQQSLIHCIDTYLLHFQYS